MQHLEWKRTSQSEGFRVDGVEELARQLPDEPSGLVAAGKLATAFLEKFVDHRFGRELLGVPELSADMIRRALLGHDFPSKETISKDQYLALTKVVGLKEEVSRHIILQAFEDAKTFGLAPHEVVMVKASCVLGSVYDQLAEVWQADVIDNPNNAKAKALGLTNQYTIIVGSPATGFRQVAYGDRYPGEIGRIAERWHEVAQELANHTDPEARAMASYLYAYVRALTSNDQAALPELWRDVDRAWMAVGGRLQPISFREYGYYDPEGIRVFPDFRLALVDAAIASQTSQTREAIRMYLGRRYGNTQAYQSTANAIDTVQLYPIADIVFAGSLDFQPAGQSLPNEEIVQKELGTKVYLNPQVISTRWGQALGFVERVFPQDRAVFESVNADHDGYAIMVAGHEFGEPMFQMASSETALGPKVASLLNEDLATLCVTGIMRDWVREGRLPEESLTRHALYLIGTYLRYLESGRGTEHMQPYYVGMGLLGMTRMLEVGFVKRVGDAWRVNLDRLGAFYDASEADLDRQVAIWEHADTRGAQEYLARGVESGEIMEMIDQLQDKGAA